MRQRHKTLRFRLGLMIAGLLVANILAVLVSVSKAQAYTLITSRSIKMSNSAIGGVAIHHVAFTTAATYNVASVEIQYCTDPFIGAACTAPTGLDVNEATPLTINNQVGITGMTLHAITSTNRVVLTRSTSSITSATAVSFDLGTGVGNDGIKNPTTLGTFYARIGTFASTDGTGAQQDAGGVALSTANQLTITAKVQETLTFCVYVTGVNCAGGTGTALALGDVNGVLSSTTTDYTGSAKFGLASNAPAVVVRMKGATLTAGTFTITQQGTTCTADSTTSSVEQFGVRVTPGTNVTADPVYACGSGLHAFDGANTVGTYGDDIASTAVPLDEVQSTMEFNAKAATTTEASVYTTTLTFIATGTF
ncbi:MAG: exported protein of unknown function [Candidatus Saccharibacteria bacterium]|nr:exported protein of unknown function [Candidatus Saccharibacteria bacterium]